MSDIAQWQSTGRFKPKAVSLTANTTTSLSFPLPFQRSLDVNEPDHYKSLDHLGVSSCCDSAHGPTQSMICMHTVIDQWHRTDLVLQCTGDVTPE